MPAVCLVVPCHDEQHRLDAAAFERFIGANPNVSFLFVNDGSGDGTLAVLTALHERQRAATRVLDVQPRSGKAEAIRRAMLDVAAWRTFDYVGYWDADLATPLDQLPAMMHLTEQQPACLLVLGSRIRRLGAVIERRASRHYLGRAFATIASLLLGLPVYDTQCGAKLVRADLLPALFGQPFSSRWCFDVELLARLREAVGPDVLLATTIEAPLTRWRDVGGSHLRWRDMVRAPLDLLRIHRRYNRTGA